MNEQERLNFVLNLKYMKKKEIIEILERAIDRAHQRKPKRDPDLEAQIEQMEAMVKPAYSGEFIDMMAMRASHALEQRLKDDPGGLELLSSMYCLLLYQRYVESNPKGLVKQINNQMAMEDVGAISHLVEWEVE